MSLKLFLMQISLFIPLLLVFLVFAWTDKKHPYMSIRPIAGSLFLVFPVALTHHFLSGGNQYDSFAYIETNIISLIYIFLLRAFSIHDGKQKKEIAELKRKD